MTTTKASAIVSSGVPASGDIPKGWSLSNYDPRRKVKGHEYTKKVQTSNPSPSYVTPPSPSLESSTSKPGLSYVTQPPPATVSSRRAGQPPTSEALIEQLRKDYRKRREHVNRLQTKLFKTRITPSPTSRSVINRKKQLEVIPMTLDVDPNKPFTKGPSLRFEEEYKQDPAEDRSYLVTPKSSGSSHQYKAGINDFQITFKI